MDDSTASKTAQMVAAYRARATARGDGICDDPWAAALAGDDGPELAARFDETFPPMERWLALRAGFLDRQVRRLTRGGVAQVVILGAGLDTRAVRLARDGVRFFEVDHPATQADKRARVAALAGYDADAAIYVACDFERDDFLDRLVADGFDAAAPAVIVWEGVAPYLTEAAVRATARRVATGCHPETALLFDYLSKRLVTRARVQDSDEQMLDYVAGLGEPVRWGANDVLPLLYEAGFGYARSISFDEIDLWLTGTYDRARMFRFQHIAIARVTAPPV
jgi:methyltransferase (TIGR00027 family)